MLQTEKLLKERYLLKKNLGQNAVRQTWLVQDIEDPKNKLVVIKLLAFNPQMAWDEVRLFEREAQVLQHLKHPQIPQYLDYFSLDEETGEGLPWFALVQNYIPGDSLKQLLEKGHRFSEQEACFYANNILSILIKLHELSPPVIHRDIKPSNLILGKDGKIYLVDFGSVQDKAKAEGVTFTVVGTSGYAPPEQLWGKTVPASDLYALGATLIHLLTGISPSELPQKKMQIQFKDKVNLSPGFTKWLKKLIAPAPEQRFSSARQALEALQVSDTPQILEKSTNRSKRLIPLVFTQITAIGVLAYIWYLRDQQLSRFRGRVEGIQNVGAMNRAQQAYFLENNKFTNSLSELGIGIKPVTDNYRYSIQVKKKVVFTYAVPQKDRDNYKSYVGAVVPLKNNPAYPEERLTIAIVCQTDSPSTQPPPEPVYRNGQFECPSGTHE